MLKKERKDILLGSLERVETICTYVCTYEEKDATIERESEEE